MADVACSCQACSRGLFCLDGQRGQFVRGVDRCALCGNLAWRHRTEGKKFSVGKR